MTSLIQSVMMRRPSAGGGAITDGGYASFSGSGFPSFSGLLIEALKRDMEGASNNTALYNITGLAARGWLNADSIEGGSIFTKIQSTDVVFGARAFECAMVGGDGRHGVAWNTGGTIGEIFFRDYAKIVRSGSGQWKQFRTSCENCVTDDSLTSTLTNDFGGPSQFQVFQGAGCGGATVLSNPYATSIPDNIASSVWYEREWRYVHGTPGTANGVFEFRVRRVSDMVEVINKSVSDVVSYASGDLDRDIYFILQNYLGNGYTDGTLVRMDDTRVQVGGQQRVYLGSHSTWAACLSSGGARQMQDVDVANCTSSFIRFRVQKGTLSTLSPVYGYLADASGTVNSTGYTVSGA